MDSKKSIKLITDSRCLGHDTGGGEHPETPQRLTAVEERLEGGKLAPLLEKITPGKAKWDWLIEAHTEAYLFRFEEAALSGKSSIDHPDNRLSYDTYEAALLAAGAGPLGADLLEDDPDCLPFCLIRPPGHHAEASRAMGFCFLNNAVVAARYWQKTYSRRRIMILDFDAHHGNGIQDAFEADPDVFYVSLHEQPSFSYPGTGHAAEKGSGEGAGTTLNIPFPPGTSDKPVLAALLEIVEPAAARFKPDAIVVSAGFDGHEKDDMSGLSYSTSLFGRIGETVGKWSRRWCSGRVLSILEGGYEPEALAESVEAYIEGIANAGEKRSDHEQPPRREGRTRLNKTGLEPFFNPSAIAVVGASRTPGKVGHSILANIVEGGFKGTILPINPDAEKILGLTCYPRLQDYEGSVDLAIIAVPASSVPDAVRGCIRAGVKALVVISAGFREAGDEGRELEEQITRLCRSGGVRLLGPNCLGFINTGNALNASFAGSIADGGGVSVFSQSGALCTAILDSAKERKLGLAKVVSIGNKADLTEVDLLLALAGDDQTKVIIGYLEDIRSGDEFIAAAEEASSSKPVIIMKAGTTSAGLRAASSHTGVLAGADIAYGAAFLRSGVIRADAYESLFDFAAALSMQPLPAGNRVLIITNAGGPGTMAADAVERAGLTVAALDRHTADSLKKKLPEAAGTGNPVDVLGDADPERYAAALEAAQDDPGVDAVMVILTPQAMTRPAETARAVSRSITGDKPVLAVFMGGREIMPARDELVAAQLPDYSSPERAVAALKAMCNYARWKERPPRIVTRFRVNRRRVERIIARRLRAGQNQVGEVRSKTILRAYGFRIPEGALNASAVEAVETAERVGYPVAVKIVSPDIIHKSDIGGVQLNVTSRGGVEDAFDLMMLRVRQRAPKARIDGIYVEKMLPRGVEVIIGMSRDPQFGPMLMFGLGGIFVEVMKDVTFHLAPVTHDEALLMLTSTRSYEILQGSRGSQAVDLDDIATGLQRISQLATDFPQITEIDINPFMVSESGREPFVADARITLRGGGDRDE